MKNNLMQRNFGTDEGKLIQTRYWMEIGGYGISPDMLVLTGFWDQSILSKLNNMDTSRSIEQIYGGVIRFKPLEGKNFEMKLNSVMNALNRILQVKRHVNDVIAHIPVLLKEEWHSSDLSLLPEDLDEKIKDMVVTEKTYIISEDPQTIRQLLSVVDALKSMEKRIGYYAGIYREANTLFGRMVLETVSMSMSNLSIPNKEPRHIDLEDVADLEAREMEGE